MQKINSYLSVHLPVHIFVERGTAKLETQRSRGGFMQNLSGWRSLIALNHRDKAEKIGDPCTRGHHAPVVLTEMEKK